MNLGESFLRQIPDEGAAGGQGPRVAVDTGQRGAEHGYEGGAENQEIGPFADGGGVKVYELVREGDAFVRETLAGSEHDQCAERDE